MEKVGATMSVAGTAPMIRFSVGLPDPPSLPATTGS
jgi:hypothetical protein